MLSQDDLKSVLSYSPETGQFTWIAETGKCPKIGRVVGNVSTDGYRRIGIRRKLYGAHRLAWLYLYGEMPNGEVDHINGDRSDNRAKNLRLLDRRRNAQNIRKAHPISKTGVLGVHSSATPGKFRASIGHLGKTKGLGTFDNIEAASAAYIQAKRFLHEACTI